MKELSAIPTKWYDTLKQCVGCYLSVFGHFVGLTLKGLKVKTSKVFEKERKKSMGTPSLLH